MKEIYLDNSATTKPLPEVVQKMIEVLTEGYGNPSSLHNKGLEAEKYLKEAREKIAEKLGVHPEEIYFTSGGTEGNNLAVKGAAYHYQNRGRHLITTGVEHPSVLESFQVLEEEGFEVTYLKTDKFGLISLDELRDHITKETILVSIIHVNNELGAVNDLLNIGQVIKGKNRNTLFHTDCVQSFGKLPINPEKSLIDLITISGHKIHGPKGIGVLYKKKGVLLKTQQVGGGQEKKIRCGTENVPGIAGLIPALEALPDYTEENPLKQKLDSLRKHFLKGLKKINREVIINSPPDGAPHILSISFPGIKGEVLIHSLEAEGIYVSTGSACHSRNKEKSHVLRAVGLPAAQIDGTIRISFSSFNTEEEIDYTIEMINKKLEIFF